MKTRSSAYLELNMPQIYEKYCLKRFVIWEMTFKDTQVIATAARQVIYHFPCSYISSALCFQQITTIVAYVTACDIANSFTFNNEFKITSHVHFMSMCTYIVVKNAYMPSFMVFRKISNNSLIFRLTYTYWYQFHSVSHMISDQSSVVTMSLSCTISELLSLIS